MMKGEPCILCGSKDKELLFQQGEWTVYRCQQCGLGVLEPRPSQERLASLYQDSYFETRYDEGAQPGTEAMHKRLSMEAHRIRFFESFLKQGRVLDIGSGRGYFLLACRERGYEAEGFDVSEDAAEYVRNTLNIPVSTGNIKDAPFKEGAFDVVTIWHALEHMENPRVYLEQANRLLRPDGLLVVDVPNYLSIDARKYGDVWDGWSLPYHFFHFTPKTLDQLLSEHDFTVIRRKTYHSEWVKSRLRKIPVVSLFARLIAKLYYGTSYAIVARKNGGAN